VTKERQDQSRHDTAQLFHWKSKFGDEYIKRNIFRDWKLDYGKKAFRRMLGNFKIDSILEIGSNTGLNLRYLTSLTGDSVELYAVEPNKKAFSILCTEKNIRLKKAWNTSAFEIPLPDSSIDMVFTSGVLIHISPNDLKQATDEIVRVSKRYILCIEYFSHKPKKIKYQGKDNLLFKMDYGAFYLDNYPNLKCIDYGFLWQRELKVFDNLNWWMFDKKITE
jgi:pseudaminic acid biosynthesis-associated methylase